MRHATVCTVVAVVMTGAACGGNDDKLRVDAYCAFGAKSEAQWRGCVDHVTEAHVEAAESPAARCALDGSDACDGAGSFWDTWLSLRSFCSDPEVADPDICTGRLAEYLDF